MENIFFQSLIDVDAWNEAQWSATAFFHDPEGRDLPLLGLVFGNIEAGKKIFRNWVERLGTRDRFEELTVAIIEGDILGEEAGYSMHVSSDPFNTERRLRAEGLSVDWDRAVLLSRFKRMSQTPGSSHLNLFKTAFQEHKRYLLVPVTVLADPILDLAVEKSEIHFRLASEIAPTDPDAVVFPYGAFESGKVQ
jgi:hypothetical protein